jgi:hypothetical protein
MIAILFATPLGQMVTDTKTTHDICSRDSGEIGDASALGVLDTVAANDQFLGVKAAAAQAAQAIRQRGSNCVRCKNSLYHALTSERPQKWGDPVLKSCLSGGGEVHGDL